MSDLEDLIRARIRLGPDEVREVERLAGVFGMEAETAAMLEALANGYVNGRIAEEAKNARIPSDVDAEADAWGEHRKGGDGWEADDYRQLLKRSRGRPPNDPLLFVHDVLAAWWDDLPPPEGTDRRNVWRPEFDHDEDNSLTTPAGGQATLFLTVAKFLDKMNTASNCNAVADRARHRKRSPAARTNRAEYRAAYAKQRRSAD
ncbi:MAG: hypothetical protein JSS36_02095 [Proteobacteria bacterium]|nr:hypothetical protein [Pseudomonadota bacterium]